MRKYTDTCVRAPVSLRTGHKNHHSDQQWVEVGETCLWWGHSRPHLHCSSHMNGRTFKTAFKQNVNFIVTWLRQQNIIITVRLFRDCVFTDWTVLRLKYFFKCLFHIFRLVFKYVPTSPFTGMTVYHYKHAVTGLHVKLQAISHHAICFAQTPLHVLL